MENVLMVKANNMIPERKLMYFKLSSYEQEQKISKDEGGKAVKDKSIYPTLIINKS
jgi:hypothetical protein